MTAQHGCPYTICGRNATTMWSENQVKKPSTPNENWWQTLFSPSSRVDACVRVCGWVDAVVQSAAITSIHRFTSTICTFYNCTSVSGCAYTKVHWSRLSLFAWSALLMYHFHRNVKCICRCRTIIIMLAARRNRILRLSYVCESKPSRKRKSRTEHPNGLLGGETAIPGGAWMVYGSQTFTYVRAFGLRIFDIRRRNTTVLARKCISSAVCMYRKRIMMECRLLANFTWVSVLCIPYHFISSSCFI